MMTPDKRADLASIAMSVPVLVDGEGDHWWIVGLGEEEPEALYSLNPAGHTSTGLPLGRIADDCEIDWAATWDIDENQKWTGIHGLATESPADATGAEYGRAGMPPQEAIDQFTGDNHAHWSFENGEVRLVNEQTGGEKGTKLARFDLIPGEAMWTVAEHYGIGAEKYADNNWRRGYNWSLSLAALERHLQQFKAGEDYDDETGSPHMAAVVFHALALLTFMDEHPELDDRWTS